MGRLSQAMFGKYRLPKSALVYAGSYVPGRKDAVRRLFSGWRKIKGQWIKYTYAMRGDSEYIVIFNVYGAALMLEVIQALKDGGTKKVFFAGAMGSKDIPIGTVFLPTSVLDAAGVVSVDAPKKRIVLPDKSGLRDLAEALKKKRIRYASGKIISVPAVMHGIAHVKKSISDDRSVLGVELEVSTFCHFSQKADMKGYALLYVTDNRKHDILSQTKNAKQAGNGTLRAITKVAFEVLG